MLSAGFCFLGARPDRNPSLMPLFAGTDVPWRPKMSHKIRVLIVDNDVVMAKYLASHLSRGNFEVTLAATDQEALRVFRVFDPALVLVDPAMNGVKGTE